MDELRHETASLDLRFAPDGFRLNDFIVRLLSFDRRECGPNASFSYVVVTGPRGDAALSSEQRTPRMRVKKLEREVTANGHWLFLPFGVFTDTAIRCADGANADRRPRRDRRDGAWMSRARSGDCAGFLVGVEDGAIVVRPAFNEWPGGGDSAIVVVDDLGGMAGPVRAFVASFAQ
jgi:hypothetical protein